MSLDVLQRLPAPAAAAPRLAAFEAAPDAPETSIDPQDWSQMRALGHRMVDDMMSFLEGVREQPVWRALPETVLARLRAPVPRDGVGADAAYEEFLHNVLPYRLGNVHPRFWGYVMGTGTPLGMMAEMLAAGMNSSYGATESVAPHVEAQVVGWIRDALGFASDATGVLVGGCSTANLIGLAAARARHAGAEVGRVGVAGAAQDLVGYCSEETHNSVAKAFSLLGLGSDALRPVPAGPDLRVRVDEVARMVRADRQGGLRPFCVVGNAGTVSTGAVDDLDGLAELCAREGLWFHVDGAFGALAALSPRLRPRVAGLQRADSLAFDLHKWMYMPYDVGCALVRDAGAHRAAFSVPCRAASYLAPLTRGVGAAGHRFDDLGPDLSRSFRALKVWLSLRAYGLDAFTRQIEQNVDQARYLALRVDQHPELELVAPVQLNVVCFRYHPTDVRLTPECLDALNAELLMRLQESGVAVPSGARVRGCFALRVANTNHRSRRDDFDVLVDAVVETGRELAAAAPAGAPSSAPP